MLAVMLFEWVALQLNGPTQILVVELNRPADGLLIAPLRPSEHVGRFAPLLRSLLPSLLVRSRDRVSRLLLALATLHLTLLRAPRQAASRCVHTPSERLSKLNLNGILLR
jgi:hypothetical protein